MYMNLSKLWEIEKDREAWCTAGYGAAKMTERLNNSNKSNDQSAFEEAVGSRESHTDSTLVTTSVKQNE